jgi:hypothetical protein
MDAVLLDEWSAQLQRLGSQREDSYKEGPGRERPGR